ncbi:MAG: histidinol dehydrogenase [Bifidobacteriaceae bacterium]|jgi:histidinol dehydrogenase|nr:histidinol dehydrogenase [Bifidobacteriaceae bacterium]
MRIVNQKNLTVFDIPRVDFNAVGGGNDVIAATKEIVDRVKNEGVSAINFYSEKFDRCVPDNLKVSQSEIDDAYSSVDDELKESISESIKRVKSVSETSLPETKTCKLSVDAEVEIRYIPMQRAGLYVPGGKAVYPSSVIMNAAPAIAAGVKSVAVFSPPQSEFCVDGKTGVHPTILATCKMLGVTEVYAIGGAAAISAMAYGVDLQVDSQGSSDASDIVPSKIKPVNVITGPGNIFVSSSKKLVSDKVAIDSEAGPTEIIIVANEFANPDFVAADLIGQAEHDEMASSVLVTESAEFADRVNAALDRLIPLAMSSERVKIALSNSGSGIFVVDSIDRAIDFANEYAGEHLEIHIGNADNNDEQMFEDSLAAASKIYNAGAIFIGEYSPVPLGDYIAGSNHVLPTNGTAKYSSGLGVHNFLKPVELIKYKKAGLKEVQNKIRVFADEEALPSHADAVDIRFK